MKYVKLVVSGTATQVQHVIDEAHKRLGVTVQSEAEGNTTILSFPMSPNQISPIAIIAKKIGLQLIERRLPL